MTEHEPEIDVTRGSPALVEAEAARAAVLALWREDQARAAREAPADPWSLAARAEAIRSGTIALRLRGGAAAWRLSSRFSAVAETHLTAGRGDAK